MTLYRAVRHSDGSDHGLGGPVLSLRSPTLDRCLVAVYDQGGRPQRKKVYEVASGH
ncbi:MAG: hypothetical protein ACLT9P_06620 [Evtepia gabavorous]